MYKINKDAVCEAIYSTNVVDKNGKENKALRFDKVILTSGKFSIFFIDHRVLSANPSSYKIITNELTELARSLGAEHVISSDAAGIFWGSVVSNNLNTSFSVMRKETDESGLNKHMGAIPEKVNTVLPVDDLNTTFGTVNKVLTLVNSLGYSVKNYILSIDREEYTPENLETFKKFGTNLIPLVTGKELINYGFENNKISQDKVEMVSSYKENPDDFAVKIIEEYPEWVLNHPRLEKALKYYENNEKVLAALKKLKGEKND